MHFHMTGSQALIDAFTLTLCILFALATIVQFRLQRARPFRNSLGPGAGQIPLLNRSFSPFEEFPDKDRAVITDFGVRYTHSPRRRAEDPGSFLRERE